MSKVNTSLISQSVNNELRKKASEGKLSIVLGKLENTDTIDRSINNEEEIISASSVLFSVDPLNITEAIRFPNGVNGMWRVGSTKKIGSYTSKNLSVYNEDNWCLYFGNSQYGNTVFMILSTTKNNRLDLEGAFIPLKDPLNNISGNITTAQSGDILYCAVKKVPDTFVTSYNSGYIPLPDSKNAIEEREQYNTSISSKATTVCGAGNQQRCGTCCLYYSEGSHDIIAGTTQSAGDFYKCIPSKCYECIDIANSLGMRYYFNQWTGPTGSTGSGQTGENCANCGVTNDLYGPCKSTIEWSSSSYYESILADSTVSGERHHSRNATYEKKGIEEYSSCVSRVAVDFSNVSQNNRKPSAAWKGKKMYVPFLADVSSVKSREPVVEILTVVDMNGIEYMDGIAHASDHGLNVRNCRLNTAKLLEMFPDIPTDRYQLDLIPQNGLAPNLNKIFTTGTLLNTSISRQDVVDAGSIQTDFNVLSIQEVKDTNGVNALSGTAPRESFSTTMSVVIEAHLTITPGTTNPPTKGSNVNPGGVGTSYAEGTHQTTENQVQVLASKLKTGSTTNAIIEIASTYADNFVAGLEFTDATGSVWTIDSITRPTSKSGSDVDKTASEILHIDKTVIDMSIVDALRVNTFFGV
jgi:hypothetical protein